MADSNLDPERCRAHRLPEKVFELLEVRWAMVQHPCTAVRVLHDLTDGDSLQILIRMAEHCEAHPDTLAQLATHPSKDVRAAVSENIHASFEVLTRLVNDDCPDVRYRLAENYRIPLAHLGALCDDENPYVAMRAKKTLQRLEGKNAILIQLPPLSFEDEMEHRRQAI